jgi:hypothetical protein
MTSPPYIVLASEDDQALGIKHAYLGWNCLKWNLKGWALRTLLLFLSGRLSPTDNKNHSLISCFDMCSKELTFPRQIHISKTTQCPNIQYSVIYNSPNKETANVNQRIKE